MPVTVCVQATVTNVQHPEGHEGDEEHHRRASAARAANQAISVAIMTL